MFTNSKLAKSIRLAMAIGAASTAMIASNAVIAQETPNAEDKSVEKISVTGSRIKRLDMEGSTPIQITSDVEIKLSGFTRIEDLLNSLPQIEASQTSFISNGASGAANVDLRGLGSTRTLVLINGRRMAGGTSGAADVNQIPAALVKRVEVLTGGGSSTYGSDAVAGVVNFIMDTDFEGLEFTAGVSGFQHNNDNDYIQGLMDAKGFDYPEGSSGIDGKSYNFDLSVGGSFDGGKGHAVAYTTFRRDTELRQESRDYTACALNSAGTSCGGSGNAIVPNFYMGTVDADGNGDYGNFTDYWTLDANSDGFTIPSSGNIYNYAPINHIFRPDERYSLGAFVNYEINEHFNPYLEVSHMRDVTKAQIAESGTFFNESYIIDYDSPLISDTQRSQLTSELGIVSGEQFATYIGKRNVEGGPRASNFETNTFRAVTGIEGQINDNWSYDVSFQFSSLSLSNAYINDFFGPRIKTAVDSEACAADSDCIPYEVFTYNGVTEESAGALTGVGIFTADSSQMVLSGYVSGDLDFTIPSADVPIAAAVGMEYRKDDFELQSDEVFEKGLLLGQGGPTPSLAGGFDVTEIYAEFSIPVLDNLFVDIGGRYSDYSTSGGISTYKIAVDWDVLEDWKVRASFNTSVRAPNVNELFSAQGLGLWSGTDPCSGDTPTLTAAQCANTGVTASQYGNIAASPASQYNSLTGGNPDLAPEEADTISFGIVANPIENLNFSIDYWDIEMAEVIGTVGAELTVEQCGTTGNAVFCDNVIRSSAGSLWVGQAGYVQATAINLAGRHWRGVDVSMNHELEAFGGNFTTKLIGTYMLKKEYDALPGVETAKYDCTGVISSDCFAQPDWRHTMTVSYTTDSFWSVSAKWRYYGQVDYDGVTDTLVADGISGQSYIDLTGSFDVTENVSALVGVNNILDREPPLVGGTLSTNGNAVAGFYDTLGRYIFASVTVRF
jgi:outer membrane receptor protein involved in Fe transport